MAKPGKAPSPKPNPRDPSSYDALDSEWRKVGLSGPARRALVDPKLYKVSDLRNITIDKLTSLQGIGKSAVARLKVVMKGKKIKFLSP
jgi:hypothetical protein